MCPTPSPEASPVCNTTAFTSLAMRVWGAALPDNVAYLREFKEITGGRLQEERKE